MAVGTAYPCCAAPKLSYHRAVRFAVCRSDLPGSLLPAYARKSGGLQMTRLLEQAFSEASKLPPQEQDALADWLLAELRSEKRWAELFANSQQELAKLAAE